MSTESLEPTDLECSSVLERFPNLTASGFYPYEAYQRENDRCAREGIPLGVHRPPVLITRPDVRAQIALVRLYLREHQTNIGAPFSRRLCLSFELKYAVERWTGERISNGAAIAGALLEGCPIGRNMTTASAFIWLSATPELHARLSDPLHAAIAYINGALACVPK
jgi:hypothetical protein